MHNHSKIAEEQRLEAKPSIWECKGGCGGRLLATEGIDLKDTWNYSLNLCTPCAKQEYGSRKKS